MVKKKQPKNGLGVVDKMFKSIVPAVLSSVLTLLNRVLDALPEELHLPRYKFCGRGMKLEETLARGEYGINELDKACHEHDIAYTKTTIADV